MGTAGLGGPYLGANDPLGAASLLANPLGMDASGVLGQQDSASQQAQN